MKQRKAKVTKRFNVDFFSRDGALTLPIEAVVDRLDRPYVGVECSKTHTDGWTIRGVPSEDCCEWVNDFEADHLRLGAVWGNFENEVYATSERAYRAFYAAHPPEAWDYSDI